MLPSIPKQGRKVRFLLHALYAGWSPLTKATHRHCGAYRSNIKDGHLVLFKGEFFLVLGNQSATLVTRVKNSRRREFSDVAHFSYRMKFHRRNPFLISHFGEGKKLFNLEYPEWGLLEPQKQVEQFPLKEIHGALTEFITETGAAPCRKEFLDLVRPLVGCQERAYRAIKAGEGKFWKAVQIDRAIKHYPVLLSKVASLDNKI
jgi:hypothetical protein|uniref:Uncharacterized protein n=1 Tax=Desulfobacca acetoxidans TaxID=60893 RepID=A0A7C3ZCM6_9BACT